MFEGEFEHRDSTGGFGRLSGGDLQWMTAGSGVIHEEKQPKDFIEKGGIVHGIQLWINLPREFKMTKPKYQDIGSSTIPIISENGNRLRIIAGNYKNVTGPAVTFTPMLVIHGISEKNSNIELDVPENYNSLIYVTKGNLLIGTAEINETQMALMNNDGALISIASSSGAEFVLLSGKPINEPIVQYGPFVMNSMAEIKQAFLDYSQGLMGKI
jgi:redox-sensitive bicupin YhaK (pirin superfamily)